MYTNSWIRVEEHDVLNPAGNPGIYGVVRFRNLAIGIIPIDDEGNTWLVGQHRYPLDTYTWEIPEGGGDPASTPLESAQRELREETGLTAEHYELLLTLQTSNRCTDEIAYIFTATGLQQLAPIPEETEQITVKKLPLEEAFEMVARGEIRDAMSVAGLLSVQLNMLQHAKLPD